VPKAATSYLFDSPFVAHLFFSRSLNLEQAFSPPKLVGLLLLKVVSRNVHLDLSPYAPFLEALDLRQMTSSPSFRPLIRRSAPPSLLWETHGSSREGNKSPVYLSFPSLIEVNLFFFPGKRLSFLCMSGLVSFLEAPLRFFPKNSPTLSDV